MWCTFAPPDEYDVAVHVRWRCGLLSDYFDHSLIKMCDRNDSRPGILCIKCGKVSVRNVRTYVRNGGRGQLSIANDVTIRMTS